MIHKTWYLLLIMVLALSAVIGSSAGAFSKNSLRVIGISDGKEARAYSVPRLYRHEVANSSIGGKQIAAAY